MLEIRSSLPEFKQALSLESVVCDAKGRWGKVPRLVHRVRVLFGQENKRVASIGRAFNQCLDQLEQVPVPYEGGKRAEFEIYLEVAEEVKKLLKSRPSSAVKKELNLLKSRLNALSTRLGKEAQSDLSEENLQKAIELLSAWKEKKVCFVGSEKATPGDEFKLFQACRNSFFIKRILKDPFLRDRFFTWAIRDNNGVETFIQYPSICEKLMRVNLSARIGFYENKGEGLRIESQMGADGEEKIVTLPFEGTRISILDEQRQVEFRGGYSLTIGKIFQIFRNREWEIGNLEYLSGGIWNWNPKKMGWFNAKTNSFEMPDMERDRWWEELPVVEEISIQEAVGRYGKEAEDEIWFFAIKGSRESLNHNPVGAHGWLQAVIPYRGKYRVYDLGKNPEWFPKKWYQYISAAVGTLPGVVCFPDENIFNTHRQVTSFLVTADHNEGTQMMRSVKKDVLRGKAKKLPFQYFSKNCFEWAYKKTRHHFGAERVPDFSRPHFWKVTCSGAAGAIHRALKPIPHFLRWLLLTSLVSFFGGWRGRHYIKKNGQRRRISLINHMPWSLNKGFFHPANLQVFFAKS